MEELVVFDLDGTLAASKSSIDTEMAKLLDFLLSLVKVAVISGGTWLQFEERGARAQFCKYQSSWERLYSEDFTGAEKLN